jgi:hypothetical protein
MNRRISTSSRYEALSSINTHRRISESQTRANPQLKREIEREAPETIASYEKPEYATSYTDSLSLNPNESDRACGIGSSRVFSRLFSRLLARRRDAHAHVQEPRYEQRGRAERKPWVYIK